jgi:hypothetical protein
MDTPNIKYIKDINSPPSPKMKRAFLSLTGKRFEPDIRVKGGAGLAIATVVTAMQTAELPKSRVGQVILPAACFCSKYSESTGHALPSSLVDEKYRDGYMVSQLGKALKEFNRASLATGRKKHVAKAVKVKRSAAISLEAPKLEELTQVRRGYGK